DGDPLRRKLELVATTSLVFDPDEDCPGAADQFLGGNDPGPDGESLRHRQPPSARSPGRFGRPRVLNRPERACTRAVTPTPCHHHRADPSARRAISQRECPGSAGQGAPSRARPPVPTSASVPACPPRYDRRLWHTAAPESTRASLHRATATVFPR